MPGCDASIRGCQASCPGNAELLPIILEGVARYHGPPATVGQGYLDDQWYGRTCSAEANPKTMPRPVADSPYMTS
jgi:hypothetical protein